MPARREAREETLRILDLYREFAENVAALPVYSGRKSASERFPGAIETFSIEALMPDGKALQSGTSHDLGQNFARAYDIKFTDADQAVKYVHTTSWGISWRMLGAIIMAHGDDRGLRIPPKLAPTQAVFVPIVRSGDERAVEVCNQLARKLADAGLRVRVDARDEKPGWKYSEWDMRGVPVRIEIGPRDVDAGTAVLARRDRNRDESGQRQSVAVTEIEPALRAAARRDSSFTLRAGGIVSAKSHDRRGRPKRVFRAVQHASGDDRHRVVRARRVRGGSQAPDDGDDACPARTPRRRRSLHGLRGTGKGSGLFCAIVLRASSWPCSH